MKPYENIVNDNRKYLKSDVSWEKIKESIPTNIVNKIEKSNKNGRFKIYENTNKIECKYVFYTEFIGFVNDALKPYSKIYFKNNKIYNKYNGEEQFLFVNKTQVLNQEGVVMNVDITELAWEDDNTRGTVTGCCCGREIVLPFISLTKEEFDKRFTYKRE